MILWWPTTNDVLLLTCSLILLLTTLCAKRFNQFKHLTYLFAGFLYALLACHLQWQTQMQQPQKLTFKGYVDSLPKKSSQKLSFISHNSIKNQTYLLNWYKQKNRETPEIHPGELYQFEIRLKPPSGTVNGVGFDREKWLFRNRIDAIGTIKSATLIDSSSSKPKHLIDRWRYNIATNIEQNFSANRTIALVQALSIGDKSHFEHQDFQRFQATGTAHLIAISGLHIGMVASIGWLLGTLLFWLWPQQKLSKPVLQVMIGLALALFYALLAGFAVSTQRALIMLAVYAFFKLSRRQSFAWDVWSISMLLVLLLDPLNVLDAGFWLSFVAVAVLILCFQGIKQTHRRISQFFIIQWRLLLGMLPLSLLVFSHVNLLTPVVNMVMIPVMTLVIVPLIMLLLGSFTLLKNTPDWLVSSLEFCSQWFLNTLDWLSVHAVMPINFAIEHGWQMLLLGMGVLVLILPKAVPQRHWGLLLIVLAYFQPQTELPQGQFTARFFDVGQGLAVHIETQNHHLLYDVGAAYDSGFNMADAILLPYFKQRKVKRLDALILSHQDNDHSGAADDLLRRFKVDAIYGTEENHQPCIAGLSWQWDDVTFTVISPYNLTPYLKNNSSCVLKIESADGFSLLLTGDIESPVEYRLSQMPKEQLAAQVLLVPHHGSKTSSTESFIKAVNPQIAINSSGQYNPFNHPAADVIATYQQLGVPIFDTQDHGMIELSSDSWDKLKLLRQSSPQIWRKKSPE